MEQEYQVYQCDDQVFFEQCCVQCFDCVYDEIGVVVDCLDVDVFGEFICKLGDFVFYFFDYGQGVFVEVCNDDFVYNVVFVVQVDDVMVFIGYQFDLGDVVDQYWCVFFGVQNQVFDIFDIVQVVVVLYYVFGFGYFDYVVVDVVVVFGDYFGYV